MEPQVAADYQNDTGEGPLWHEEEGKLYWVDIPNGKIFWYDPVTGEHDLFFEGPVLGGFTIQEDGAFLLFLERGGIALLKDGKLDYLIEKLPGEEENRFNDVFADSGGRVFCGTMPLDSSLPVQHGKRLGSLYRLDTNGSISKVLEGVGISNGMGLTPDRKGLYYTDSLDYAITVFDYDHAAGEVTNRRTFTETAGEGLPDGMTVDSEGYVWSARAGGWALHRYAPDGAEVQAVRFPARLVSSVTFGGADLTDIFVTTIGGHNRGEDGPGAGALFRLNLGIRGVQEFRSRIRI